jgi:hypothetical protein
MLDTLTAVDTVEVANPFPERSEIEPGWKDKEIAI